MPSLYNICQEALLIQDELAENYGELTPELEARITALLAGGTEKVEHAAIVVKHLMGDAELCKTEAKRLSDRAVGLEHASDRLKAMILAAVDTAFNGKIKTARFSIWGQTSATHQAFEPASDVDMQKFAVLYPQFARVSIDLNRKALADAAKSGEAMPAEITVTEQPGTRFLRIK